MIESSGEQELYRLLREVFPSAEIKEQYVLREGLRLDFYIPQYNIAWEFDGVQHTIYSSFFFKNKAEFYQARERDKKKEYTCKQLGINLIRLSDKDELTVEQIKAKYETIGPGDGIIKDENQLSQKVVAKQRRKAAQKKAYEARKASKTYQSQVSFFKELRRKLRSGL